MLVTLLTFSVGRVQRVEAVATSTAAVISSALLGLGVVYIGYQCLTGANVSLPSQEYVENYLRSVGESVARTPSGSRVYDKIYSFLRNNGILEDYDVHLTQEQLLDLYNDNKVISDMQDISSFDLEFASPLVNFDYPFTLSNASMRYYISSSSIYDTWYDYYSPLYYNISIPSGPRVVLDTYSDSSVRHVFTSDLPSDVVNIKSNNSYTVGRLVNGAVEYIQYIYYSPVVTSYTNENWHRNLVYNTYNDYWTSDANSRSYLIGNKSYPILLDKPIYDSVSHELIPVRDIDGNRQITPQYPNHDDPDGNKYPIVPYVQLPSDKMWGFNLGDALTDLINRGGQIITASWLGQLINQYLQSLSGTGDYNDFSEYTDNSITYYNNTYFDTENNYYTYNYDISKQEDIIPVDLNTIKQYTNNTYLDKIKEHASNFGDTLATYVVFWHNADSELFYVICGSFIVILIGAFIGKWGHS